MNEEVRAAADRLKGLVGCKIDFENAPVDAVADMWTLARAYLAEHDETAIDESWLRSVGFDDDQWKTLCRDDGTTRMTFIEGQLAIEVQPKELPGANRGHLRRLAAALQIPLKEPPHA